MRIKLVIYLIVLGIWIYREWSWRSESNGLNAVNIEIKSALSEIYSIARPSGGVSECKSTPVSSGHECSNEQNIISAGPILKILEDVPYIAEQFELNIAKQMTTPAILFQGYSDIVVILMMVLCMQLELRRVHSDEINIVGAKVQDKYIVRRKHMFYSKISPLCNIAFFSVVLIISCIAWLGLIDRHNFTGLLIKLVLFWIIANPISVIIDNLIRVYRYLPCFSQFLEKAKDYRCWFWLSLRILFGPGVDMLSKGYTGIWFLLLCLKAWPLRYFYFNRTLSCDMDDSSIDLFLLRVFIHLSCLVLWYCYVNMQSLNMPQKVRNYFNLSIHFTTLFAIFNSVVFLFSLLWFVCFSSCTWWASIVVLSFLNVHVFVVLVMPNTVSSLLHRYNDYWVGTKEIFLSAYVQTRLSTYKVSKKDNIEKLSNEDKEKLRLKTIKLIEEEGEWVYNKVMDQCCQIYIWVHYDENDIDQNIFHSSFLDSLKQEVSLKGNND